MPEVIVQTKFYEGWNIGDRVEIEYGERLNELVANGYVKYVNPEDVKPKEEVIKIVEEPEKEEIIEVAKEPEISEVKKRGRPKKK